MQICNRLKTNILKKECSSSDYIPFLLLLIKEMPFWTYHSSTKKRCLSPQIVVSLNVERN